MNLTIYLWGGWVLNKQSTVLTKQTPEYYASYKTNADWLTASNRFKLNLQLFQDDFVEIYVHKMLGIYLFYTLLQDDVY